MTAAACPCGSGTAYAACCGRFHGGTAATTAEELMRSRYAAFAVGDAAYLLRTWHPATRPGSITLDPEQRWTGLEVLATEAGGEDDAKGVVEFRASYVVRGEPGSLHEISRFFRVAGDWVYVRGRQLRD
ncbi:MAG TPA: YchJ family metal-binding protein [Nocardioides sp.]|nr:YchJ family metal-binding protein [Nocardioides sp.]